MPSPGGQVSGMVGTALGLRDEVGTSGAIPTTSPRATRPHHGGKPGMTGVGISESCPRAAARSGYARSTGWHLGRPPWGRSESGANHPAAPHHHPAPGDTNAQLRRHGTAPGDRTRAANSAFGTKRSQVQILSPRPGQVSRVTGSWGLTGKPARPLSAESRHGTLLQRCSAQVPLADRRGSGG